MGESSREAAQREVETAREQLGATVEALAYRANAPKRAKDRVVDGLARVLRRANPKTSE
jgi:predicted nuclease of restriction endonuclease-like RecB superfamily